MKEKTHERDWEAFECVKCLVMSLHAMLIVMMKWSEKNSHLRVDKAM